MSEKQQNAGGNAMFFWWVCGIILLVTALLISARMGIYQELLYKRHGKHSREALYVTVNFIFGFTKCFIPLKFLLNAFFSYRYLTIAAFITFAWVPFAVQ